MPTLAGLLTVEPIAQETVAQVLAELQKALEHNGGEPAQMIHSGAGLVAFSDPAYALQHSHESPVLDWIPDRHTFVYRRPLSGLHPLYYIENWPAQGYLLFASEIKALLTLGMPRRLHLPALDALLRYGFMPAPWTAFKDIYVVPAGTILRWQRGKMLVNPASNYHLDEAPTGAETLEQIYTLLDEASAEQLPSHNRFVAFTGGGAYSVMATLLAARHSTVPISIASYRRSPSNKARPALATLGPPMLTIDGLDQAEFWIATIAGLESPDVASRSLASHQLLHTTVQETEAHVGVSGLGGSLLLADRFAGQASSGAAKNLLAGYQQCLSRSKQGIPWSAEAAGQMREEQPWEETRHARRLVRQAEKLADERMRYYYLDLRLRLPDHVVHPLQRLATQERLVLRSPYLSTLVMDVLTRLPEKLADSTPKHEIVARLLLRLMPQETSAPLPLSAPMASLLRLEKSELLQQMLGEQALSETGIFEPAAVANLLKTSKRKTVSRELLLVFTTQLFCKMFGVTM